MQPWDSNRVGSVLPIYGQADGLLSLFPEIFSNQGLAEPPAPVQRQNE